MTSTNCPNCGCAPCMCRAPGFVTYAGYTLEQAKLSVGPGWAGLLDVLFFALDFYPNAPKVTQVKEKFGGLTVYVSPWDVTLEKLGYEKLDVDTLLWTLRTVSEHFCECCGKPGEIDRSYHWLKTLCPECREERRKEREARCDASIKA